jgi:2-(1,2-epoxy-1,2-dihydrophenyl)acetyl-CoA isomerase
VKKKRCVLANLIVERGDGVVWLTLNRPEKKNAITVTMWDELTEVFEEVAARAEDLVLVVTGAGDGFCAGADLSEPDPGGANIDGISLVPLRSVSRCALRLHELPKPTLAAVNGVAVGAGCNLALSCDIVLAADRASFGQIFVQRGLSVDFGGSWLLPRLVGLHKAKELALLGEILGADDAERVGIVNRVVPAGELRDAAAEMAGRLARLPPMALSVTKQMLNRSSSMSMSEAVETEVLTQTLLIRSHDAQEAVTAFLERREGHYIGR